MKFKKTHILLIIMSLFLLVSIGSVCAEDVSADADIQAADSEPVDVLAGDPGSGGTNENTDQELINTTVEATAEPEKVGYDDDKNISVTVKDNESQEISDVDENNFTLFEGEKSLNFIYSNKIITITDKLSVGNHTILINYLGNSNYNKNSTSILLKVFGNKTLDVGTTVVVDEQPIIVPVKVFDGVDYLELAREEFGDLTLTYTNSTGNRTSELISYFTVEDGKIKLTVDDYKLVAATLTINYTNATTPLNRTVSLKQNTTVNAENKRIRENEDKNISVVIKDYNGMPLTITQNDLKVLENGNAVNFKYNNSVITITSLARGNHTLTIVYNGNDTYYTSSKTIVVSVYGNLTINPQKSANVDESKYVEITLNLSDGTELKTIESDKLTITLNYVDENGEVKNKTITGIAINGQVLKFKVEEAFSSANVTIVYEAENNLTKDVIIKINTTIDAQNQEVGDSQTINLPVSVIASNGATINVTASNIAVYNGAKKLNITYNNSVITINDKLALGVYTLTIKFTGNATFSDAAKDIVLKVYGIKADSSVNVNSTKIVNVKVNITDGNSTKDFQASDFTLKVDYKNGTVINITSFVLDNGTITFTLDDGNFTTATLVISYKGNESVKNVTLNRIYNAIIIPVNVEVDYQDGAFTFKVVDADDGSLLAGKKVTITGKMGETSLMWQKWTSQTSLATMSQSVDLTSDENGIVTLNNEGFYPGLLMPVSSDLLEAYASNGDYNITVTGSGDLKGTNTTLVKINKVTPNMKIVTFSEYYGTTKKVTILVTNSKTGKVMKGVYIKLNITGATLSNERQLTNSKGQIELGVSTLPVNTYKMKLAANDTNLNEKSSDDSFTIKRIPVTISANDATIWYNSGTTSSIKIIDKRTNKVIANAYVFFRIDSGDLIVGKTNSKGIVSFTMDLNVGKHKLTVTNVYNPDGRDVYQYSTVKKTIKVIKANAKIKASKVTAYYKGGKYFTIKLVNAKNNKAIYNAKLNIRVYISKTQYYNYNGNTGMNGQLRLALDSFKPGTYKVVVIGADSKNFAAKQVTSKFVVKNAPTKLAPKKLTAKKGKNKYFTVKVTNKKTKKAIPKIKIKIKVYTGKKFKTYTVKTNKNGIAKLNVKKLKVGKHKVYVTSANKYCIAKTAKSTIKIKR